MISNRLSQRQRPQWARQQIGPERFRCFGWRVEVGLAPSGQFRAVAVSPTGGRREVLYAWTERGAWEGAYRTIRRIVVAGDPAAGRLAPDERGERRTDRPGDVPAARVTDDAAPAGAAMAPRHRRRRSSIMADMLLIGLGAEVRRPALSPDVLTKLVLWAFAVAAWVWLVIAIVRNRP